MNKKGLLLFLLALLIIVFAGLIYAAPRLAQRYQQSQTQNDITIIAPTQQPTPILFSTSTPTVVTATPTPEVATSAQVTILDKVNLDVPFTVQAPTANWDEVHEET